MHPSIQDTWLTEYVCVLDLAVKLTTLAVLVVTTFVGLKQYKRKILHAQILKDLDLRKELLENESYCRMIRFISHRDPHLESLLDRINSSDEVCSAQCSFLGPLRECDQALRQSLDNYLNYLESIGMLFRRGYFDEEVTFGFWDYYIERVATWRPLRDYVCQPAFKWNDLARLVSRFQCETQIHLVARRTSNTTDAESRVMPVVFVAVTASAG